MRLRVLKEVLVNLLSSQYYKLCYEYLKRRHLLHKHYMYVRTNVYCKYFSNYIIVNVKNKEFTLLHYNCYTTTNRKCDETN